MYIIYICIYLYILYIYIYIYIYIYYHAGHSILEFFKVLVEVLFTTSKTEPDIFMKESPDELLYDVNVKTAWEHSLVYSYPLLLALILKNHAKTDIKVFDFVKLFTAFQLFSKIG